MEITMDMGEFGRSSNVSTTSRISTTSRKSTTLDDEEALKWAALKRLPTYQRARKGLLHGVAGDFREVDLQSLGNEETMQLLEKVVGDNEAYLKRLKKRIDRVSLSLPTIEVRFENLNVEAEAYEGRRALPSVLNFYRNVVENVATSLHILPTRKRKFSILRNISGIIKPGRLTLLLGPPGSGKSTLLQALAGKLDSNLKVTGRITYNGHELHEFKAPRTSAYISQYDVHTPLLTVRETLTFSAKCQGVGTGYEMLTELLRREKQLNITPDPYIDALMKASVLSGRKEDIITAYTMKILGLDVCADTIVGNDMKRGISGGQKKRVTTGEMLVGPVNALFMDNISTGLDSSTTFQIVNSIKQSIHIFSKSALISLLQPPPETFELFDDVILLAEGQIVYQGPREQVLEFFEFMGFKCPERKGVADYLQEVTSKMDQRQYWTSEERPYRYISVNEFSEAFKSFRLGKAIQHELATPFDRSKSHPAALTKSRYGSKQKDLVKACLGREYTLMKRSASMFLFKIALTEICALIVAAVFAHAKEERDSLKGSLVYLGALFFVLSSINSFGFYELPNTIDKLPVFYKQRDQLFYPSWAYTLPAPILGIPVSIMSVIVWVGTTYYLIGFNPVVTRMLRMLLLLVMSGQVMYSLFRFIGAVTREHIIANTAGSIVLVWLSILTGFTISADNLPKWLLWGYWTSPMMYSLNGLSTNEFISDAWNITVDGSNQTLGEAVLEMRGIHTDPYWYWIALLAMVVFIFIFNGGHALALAYLNQYGKSQAAFLPVESSEGKHSNRIGETEDDKSSDNESTKSETSKHMAVKRKRQVLPFSPLCVTFEDIIYSVDMPKEMKSQGVLDDRLVLLKKVSGAFRPGVLTALMGVSGAGKTTLLDVLAGRKNSGYIEGNILVSGYPKRQETFARVVGYCEQNDIHSALVTVYESLLYSAWLRLPAEVEQKTRQLFVEEVMELVELTPLRDALVGFPNVNGLSTGQRKRLTIAVELVANPAIIFMDEPTSGLDAREAAIVMRTVRNTTDTGRTVACTIHQPSIDIFESFDELYLITKGGEEIYFGPLGPQSSHLIEYFENITGVGKIKHGYNPATWALEITTRSQEDILGVKFADVYKSSDLYRRNKDMIQELSRPPLGSQDLHFPFKYPQSYLTQFMACLWKQQKSYWRNTSYNGIRFLFASLVSIMFGLLFWRVGTLRSTQQELFNGLGAMYMALLFMGNQTSGSVRPVVISERVVYYRERASGMYSALPYAAAQVVIEIPYTLVQVAIFGSILYPMIGFEWDPAKFFLFLYFIFITILYYIYYGMMVLSITPNQEFAAILNSVFFTLWGLYAGFIIPRKRIASWLSWYAWVCPTSWSLYGMAVAQYGNDQTKMETGQTVSEFLDDYFGFRYDFLWVAALALIGLTLLFVTVYGLSMKFVNFQRR